jgi:hypothetical protein
MIGAVAEVKKRLVRTLKMLLLRPLLCDVDILWGG